MNKQFYLTNGAVRVIVSLGQVYNSEDIFRWDKIFSCTNKIEINSDQNAFIYLKQII